MPYRTVMIDPPWNESGGGKIKRGADRHYKLIRNKKTVRDVIKAFPEFELDENAHMYLWVTNNRLADGIWLMEELGFTYITNIAWVKIVPEDKWDKNRWDSLLSWGLRFGMKSAVVRWFLDKAGLGQYFRGQHELMLFGRKGKGKDPSVFREDVDLWGRKYIGTVIFAPRGKHSEKPDEAYELVEARSKGPYLDVFARRGRKGWGTCGDEAPADDEDSSAAIKGGEEK